MKRVALALSLLLLLPRLQAAEEGRVELQQLGVLGSVLMIGAHDDDDDTHLLTYLSVGLHLRTGYLSLARGSGAQNRIGAEQDEAMGVLLTQEALAARRAQGVEQFYTRAVDFGFSKTLKETMAHWDRPEIVGDIVWILRTFRPDVVIVRYSGTPRDGHGNHQASAVLARKALLLAADPSQFPEQLKLASPWKPKRVLELASLTQPGPVTLDIPAHDPVSGVAYSEIYALARRAFRSQAMTAPSTPRARIVTFRSLDGNEAPRFLEGVDTTWNRIPGGGAIAQELAALSNAFDLRALLALRRTIESLREADPTWVAYKLEQLDGAIAREAGLQISASVLPEVVTAGDDVTVAVAVTNARVSNLTLQGVTLATPSGEIDLASTSQPLPTGQPAVSLKGTWHVPAKQAISQPYWLSDRRGELSLVGRASNPPLVWVRCRFAVGGTAFELMREVRSARGAVAIVPAVTLHPATAALVFPTAAAKATRIRVTAHRATAAGTVRLNLPPGWKTDPLSADFTLAAAGSHADVAFKITPPDARSEFAATVSAVVDGEEIAVDETLVDYPHIEPMRFFPLTRVRLVRAPIAVLAKQIGYVVGTGDEMPAALEQLGCQVTLLSAADLAGGDLARFDAIVLGIRAYNVREDVLLNRARLKEYVEGGGTLVMQYTVSQAGPNTAVDVPDFGPYPFRISAARVTVEDSAVKFTQPEHFVLNAPNAIGPEDFASWVQERGLHFASSFDPHYAAPLDMGDPGEPLLHGGLLVARQGSGIFIYTAQSWFRQLPAGVPGAYRIFANLISAGKAAR